jgi:HEPN domain-containing protein
MYLWSLQSKGSNTGTPIASLLPPRYARGRKSTGSARYAPEDPREWLNCTRSTLVLARLQGEGVSLEDGCFHTQQAVEKAIQALLMQCHVQFPSVHDIAELLTVLEEADQEIPQAIRQAERLTRFAVFTRYPGIAPPISREEHTEALHVAGEVMR